MKKLYSALSSIALLFSLPALAGPLAEKACDEAVEQDSIEQQEQDTVTIEITPEESAESPICRGGGGA